MQQDRTREHFTCPKCKRNYVVILIPIESGKSSVGRIETSDREGKPQKCKSCLYDEMMHGNRQ